FLTAPAGLPNANPPANCLVDPTYVEDIVGAEQVLLLLDRSGSMAWSSSDGEQEVCDNGLDDDGDGDTDESACAESRMNFVHGAARAFIDLQRDAGIEVGLLEFDERNSVVRSIQNLDPTNSEDFKTDISGLTPRGRTAIGDALDAAKAEFAGVASSGRSQTAFLLTDGYSNEGSDPLVRAQELRDMNVRVFTIPTGSASDVVGLERVASTTRGRTMEADPVDELPAVYAELAAHYSRAGVVLPRTRFTLLPKSGKYNPEEQGDEGRKEDVPLPEAVFKLPVEKGAEGLVAFLSGNNRDMSTWGLELELFGPDGSYYDSGSPELVVDPYYVFFRIPNPADGQWHLVARDGRNALQRSTILGFVDHAAPRLLADVVPRLSNGSDPVTITGTPLFDFEIEGNIAMDGIVRRPDGSTRSVSLFRNYYSGGWSTDFSDFSVPGVYELTLDLRVEDARPIPGESVFNDAERDYPVDVVPFVRSQTLTFQVLGDEDPDCGHACDPHPEKGDYVLPVISSAASAEYQALEDYCSEERSRAIARMESSLMALKELLEAGLSKDVRGIVEALYEHQYRLYKEMLHGKIPCDETEPFLNELRKILEEMSSFLK
ncbi:MAG: vWA domain-containing protein, partial [Myxococcota bacterium]